MTWLRSRKAAGSAALVAGLLWILAAVLYAFGPVAWAPASSFDYLGVVAFILAMLALMPAVLGLHLQQVERSGRLGLWGFRAAFLGAAAAAIGRLLEAFGPFAGEGVLMLTGYVLYLPGTRPPGLRARAQRTSHPQGGGSSALGRLGHCSWVPCPAARRAGWAVSFWSYMGRIGLASASGAKSSGRCAAAAEDRRSETMKVRGLRSLFALVALAVACAVPGQRASAQEFTVETVVTGLATIWAIDFAADGRIFLTERSGRIRTVASGRLDPEPWITLDVVESAESGLLGLALDPEFATNGFVYVAYTYSTADGGFQNRLVRLREDLETKRGMFDAVLLDDVRGGRVHDGGRVKIGPDGKLYWTMGEAGLQPLAQDRASWNGKILRINLDGTIPDDNPFPGSPVYSLGHRNPQGIAWQPGTGRLYAIEHGPSGSQSCCDEVNYIQPGRNYGWPIVFGDRAADGTEPAVIQSADATWAPGGAAFVSRGPWAGSLVFAGLRSESLYRVALDASDATTVFGFEQVFRRDFGRLRDVVEGPDGALYVSTSNRDGRGTPAPEDDRLLRVWVR